MTTNEPLPLRVEKSFRPKTYDIDFAGHVSNIVYVRWLEDLRLLLLDTYLPLNTLMERGIAPVVMRTAIEYKKPVKLFDNVVGKMWMSKMENVRGILSTVFEVNGETVASAEQTGLFVKLQNGKPVAVPDELRHCFEQTTDHIVK